MDKQVTLRLNTVESDNLRNNGNVECAMLIDNVVESIIVFHDKITALDSIDNILNQLDLPIDTDKKMRIYIDGNDFATNIKLDGIKFYYKTIAELFAMESISKINLQLEVEYYGR